VKTSRLEGSGFGFGFGAFLTSFLPLSLFPINASMTQMAAAEKSRKGFLAPFYNRGRNQSVDFLLPHLALPLHHFRNKAGPRTLIKLFQVGGVPFHRPGRSLACQREQFIHFFLFAHNFGFPIAED
jgi:hypothetical protein